MKLKSGIDRRNFITTTALGSWCCRNFIFLCRTINKKGGNSAS